MFYARMTQLMLVGAVLLIGCNGSTRSSRDITQQDVQRPMVDINKQFVAEESEQIDAYVKRRKWEMEKSGTGLRYMIYQQGTGEHLARDGQRAKVNYQVSLLDGTVCYSSEKTGPEEFLIGQDNVESGLHEGITYMRIGDRAKMILPTHLAHGLVGDQKKIPARSTIIYDIELLDLR